MRAWVMGGLLAMVAMAGCLGLGASAPDHAVKVDGVAVELPHLQPGPAVAAPPLDDVTVARIMAEQFSAPCEPGRCASMPLWLPAGLDGTLVVTMEWAAQDESYEGVGNYVGFPRAAMRLDVSRDGQVVAAGTSSTHYGALAFLPSPEPGAYSIDVAAVWGSAPYQVGLALAQEADLSVTGLPDLVMLPPDHVRIEHPVGQQGAPALGLLQKGCGPDELLEDQDTRCLRFAGILGNAGPGPFDVVLEFLDAAASPAGQAYWKQRLHNETGVEEVPVLRAEYHAVHGHYHILEFVETTLYAVDEASGTRGDDLGVGKKTGFCTVDGGFIDQRSGPWTLPAFGIADEDGNGCCYMVAFCQMDLVSGERFRMGMSPGWYDTYPWYRADQYLDISDVPDGVYDIVSVINPGGLLWESDEANNEAWTRVRITGDAVEMLAWSTQAMVGPHPDAAWDKPAPQ